MHKKSIRQSADILVHVISVLALLAVFGCGTKGANPVGNTYYVSPSGSDANPGNEPLPFRTISKAASIARAGDTVLVRGGTYYETIKHSYSGTFSAYITFKNYPGEKPVINGEESRAQAVVFNGQDYIRWEGFEVTNFTTTSEGKGVFDLMVGGSVGIQIVNNYIHHCYGGSLSLDGIRCNLGVSDLLFEDNRIEHLDGRGIRVHGSATIRGNKIGYTKRDGIWVGMDRASTFLIEKNELYEISDNPFDDHLDFIQVGGDISTPVIITIRHNKFHNVQGQNVVLENCIGDINIHDNLSSGQITSGSFAYLMLGTPGARVFNNTISVTSGRGIGLGYSYSGVESTGCYVYNNIYSGPTAAKALEDNFPGQNYIGNNHASTDTSNFYTPETTHH